MHASVGMLGVVIAEAAAERSFPEAAQRRSRRRVDGVALDDDQIHDVNLGLGLAGRGVQQQIRLRSASA